MSDVTSKVVNVIETTQGDEVQYFTLQGVLIGGFKGGNRITPDIQEIKKSKPVGGVVTAPTPHQVKRKQDREAEKLQTAEGRLQHLKNDVV